MKKKVIIEPHWNLKRLHQMIYARRGAVIIEPHWNLKSDEHCAKAARLHE